MQKNRKYHEYAMYQGEKLLAIGTSKEIAAEMGISVNTVMQYNSPSYKKKIATWPNKGADARVVVRIEDDE